MPRITRIPWRSRVRFTFTVVSAATSEPSQPIRNTARTVLSIYFRLLRACEIAPHSRPATIAQNQGIAETLKTRIRPCDSSHFAEWILPGFDSGTNTQRGIPDLSMHASSRDVAIRDRFGGGLFHTPPIQLLRRSITPAVHSGRSQVLSTMGTRRV